MISYGGIFEKGSKEYTLDDFHSLQLDKLDKFACLKESMVLIPEGEEKSSSDGDDDEDEDENSDDDVDDEAEVEGSEVEIEDVDELPKAKKSKQKGKEREILPEVIPVQEFKNFEIEDPVCCPSFIFTGICLLNDPRKNSIRSQANALMGVSKDTTRSPEDVLSTPLPGETLAMFYARSRTLAISLRLQFG